MQVFVRSLRGRVLTININGEDTIEDFKKKIQEKDGADFSKIKLTFGGHYLENNLKIEDYGIQENSTTILVMTLPGG